MLGFSQISSIFLQVHIYLALCFNDRGDLLRLCLLLWIVLSRGSRGVFVASLALFLDDVPDFVRFQHTLAQLLVDDWVSLLGRDDRGAWMDHFVAGVRWVLEIIAAQLKSCFLPSTHCLMLLISWQILPTFIHQWADYSLLFVVRDL